MKTESQMLDHQFSVKSDLQQKRRNTSLIDQDTEMRTCRTKETGQKERIYNIQNININLQNILAAKAPKIV